MTVVFDGDAVLTSQHFRFMQSPISMNYRVPIIGTNGPEYYQKYVFVFLVFFIVFHVFVMF